MNDTASIVSKVWSFCHTLRDDGVSYGDYLEQPTYLLFLKMADEYSKIYKKEVGIPAEYNWDSLKARKGADLEAHYVKLLRALGQQKGMIGQIFVKSQNQIQDPTWKTSPIPMCWPKKSSRILKQVFKVSSRSWNRLMDNNRACGTSRNSH